ncbi:MAG: ATP-binding protein [Candidatus Zhuqueibacterota bacterium]
MKKSLFLFSDRFTLILFTVAILLILFLLYYSQSIVQDMRVQSRSILEFYANLHSKATAENDIENLNFLFEQIIQKTNFPIILTDENKNPVYWVGLSVDPDDRSPLALERVKKMVMNLEKEVSPVSIQIHEDTTGALLLQQYLYYGDSSLITRLIWFPYVEIGVIGLFILVAFLGFHSIKKSEEQYIWVGMAKETAHQLGTPLSSLMGWLELLRTGQSSDNVDKILPDMENDVQRLNKVATRFSQIGSRSDLKKNDINIIIGDIVKYFQRRLPHMGKKIRLIEKLENIPPVNLNRDLFEWVIENLIKNALDAIEKESGLIVISTGILEDSQRHIFIDIKDNGKGITPHERRLVFRPGFSTKKRGWGLGLNLAKRIIEDYHRGRLLIKDTKPGEGTTMRVILLK